MKLTDSILKDIRVAVGLDAATSDFDTELLLHINSAIGELNQNGVGNFLVVENEGQVWSDLQNPLQLDGNKYFQMVPSFISLMTKLLFDPPPPSAVQFQTEQASKLLGRLKIAYEEPYVAPVVDSDM